MIRRIARRAIPRRIPTIRHLRKAAIADQAMELSVQLEEVVAEMNDLLGNAKRIVRQAESLPGGRMVAERAYGYWIPALNSYLDPDSPFNTRAMVTPMNTVHEIMNIADENGGGRDLPNRDDEDWDDED